MKTGLTILLLYTVVWCSGQAPIISKVEPSTTYPLNQLLITGAGFGTNAAQVQVWFDHVKGSVVSVNDFSITVTVPAQAKYQSIEVINLSTRLSVKSSVKFLPAFNGEGFSASKVDAAKQFSSVNQVFDMCSCDLDSDGKPDIIGTKFENSSTDMLLLRNQSSAGTISFSPFDKTNLSALNLNAPTSHIVCGDLNGDGKPDLVASRSGTTANSIFVLPNTSVAAPAFAAFITLFLDAGHFARQVVIRDLNNDGKPDIIVANSNSNVLYVFQNQSSGGTLSINPTPVKITVTSATNTLALEVQDFDGDGLADIVASQNQTGNLFFLKNKSVGSINFPSSQQITVAGSLNDLNSADLNNDGKLDLVVTNVFGAEILYLLNQSTGTTITFSSPISLSVGSGTGVGPFGVETADINGDGFPDFIVMKRGVSNIHVFLHNKNNAAPGFTAVTVPTLKASWFGKVADFDGDAKPDIAFTSFGSTNTIDIIRNKNCVQPQVLNTGPLTICPAQTITLKTAPIPNITYDWKKDGVSVKNTTDPFADITAAGSYTVTAVSESNTCSLVSAPISVASGTGTVPATAVINPITQACAGGPLTINTAAVAGASYSWTGPGGFTVTETDPELIIPNVTVDQAGIYSLRLKIGECTGDSDSKEARVIGLNNFSIASNIPSPLCEGGTAILSVNAASGHTYQWLKDGAEISGQTSTSLTISADGTYKVNVSFSGCSRITNEIPFVILKKPVAAFSTTPTTACINQTVTFTNSSTTDNRATPVYAWTFGDNTTSANQSPTTTYSIAQVFSINLTVSYLNIASCSNATTGTVTVVDPIVPSITPSVLESCPDESVTLTLTGNFSTVKWSTNESTSSIVVKQPGTYKVNTTDANGCAAEANTVIATKAVCGPVERVIKIPNVFSPNGDGQNDTWKLQGVEDFQDCTMKVFDASGRSVFEKKGYDVSPGGWDGKLSGKDAPEGVYYYIFACPDKPALNGTVLIVR